jgi:hypothetical protein
MKTITFILLFCATVFDMQAQIQSKVSAYLQYHSLDSQTVKHRSREALIKMNINTGEVKLVVPLQSFAKSDTALYNSLKEVQSKMELYFTIDGDPFLQHNNRKLDAAYDALGMLHINNHYHHVKVRFSVFKKTEQPTAQDYAYLISISFTFLPKHYELNKLEELTNQPVKISLYKQQYSFEHNAY